MLQPCFSDLWIRYFDLFEFATADLADIVAYSTTREEQLEHLRKVSWCVKEAALTLDPRSLPLPEYLVYVMVNGVFKLKVEKVQAIQ